MPASKKKSRGSIRVQGEYRRRGRSYGTENRCVPCILTLVQTHKNVALSFSISYLFLPGMSSLKSAWPDLQASRRGMRVAQPHDFPALRPVAWPECRARQKTKWEGGFAFPFPVLHIMLKSWVSNSARYLAGTQAARAGIHSARCAVHNCLNPLNIGLPNPVGPPVGVGYLNTERHILAAKLAFCHVSHLLFTGQIQNNRTILSGLLKKCKPFLLFSCACLQGIL